MTAGTWSGTFGFAEPIPRSWATEGAEGPERAPVLFS
jgi:hypothetical protein